MPQDVSEKSRISNPGIYVSGGQITQSDFDSKEYRELMQDYADMRNDDSIASTSVDILVNPILNANFKIEPGYKENETQSEIAIEAAKFVQETYNQLQSGLKYYMRHKLLALYYGFSMFEKIWKRGDVYEGKVVNKLIDLYPIQQDTIWWWKYDEKTNFLGIKQEQRIPEGGFKHIDIDSDRLHVYTPFEEYKNIQGRSLLRPSRLVWKIKKQIWLASGRASSRGAGIPEFIITPSGNATTDTALKSKLETIAKNVGNSENSYVISQKDLVEFKLHTLQNQEANLQLIQQANTEMFYNTMSEFVTSGIGGNGSRAATGEHKSPYFDAMDAIIKTFEDNEDKLIREIIENTPYIGQLTEEEMPYCKIERPKNTDVIAISNLISTLISSRAITNTPDVEVYVRNILGLPEKTEEEIEEVKPIEEIKQVEELKSLSADEGRWITVNGRHVFIGDDETHVDGINWGGKNGTYYNPIDKKIHNWSGMDSLNDMQNAEKNFQYRNQKLYYRVTDNENEHLIENLKSKNHLTGEKYNGMSVNYNTSYYYSSQGAQVSKGKKYIGVVSGKIIGWGDDGEPILSNVKWHQKPVDIKNLPIKYKEKNIIKRDTEKKPPWSKLEYGVMGGKDTVNWSEEKKEMSQKIFMLNQKYVENFELSNAQLVLSESQTNAEKIVTEVYKKIIDDVAMKLANNPKEPVNLGYKKELIDRLSSIYNRSYKPGQQDVRKEYARITSTRLAMTPIVVEGTNEKLVAKVDTLYSAIENSIRDELLLINQQNIDNAGGMENYIKDRFGQTQKQIRNDLASIASSGYLAGRNDQLAEFESKDPDLKRLYLTTLEGRENVCEVCRPVNFMTFNREEAESLGLNFYGTPINPLCLGGFKCRCAWMPAYSIKDKGSGF